MRNFHFVVAGVGAIILAGLHFDSALADAPAVPAAPTTLWNYLGIPQGANKIQDSLLNRSGNRPDAERTNPLTRIADPANLQSPNPSIQAAAKIKQQEDLAPQKIKAIKYLATVGCGCYQKMGVREALLDSLDDCTEEVRYEAAKAFAKVAGTYCDKCGESCCNAKVMNKLKELADGTDERCCPKEASERVRQAARQALNACKNKLPATNVTPGTGPEPLDTHRKPEGPGSTGTQIPPAPTGPSPTPAAPAAPTPTPAPGAKPLDLPGDAPAGSPAPVPPAPSKVGYVPAPTAAMDPTIATVTFRNIEAQPGVSKIEVQPSVNQVEARPTVARPKAQPSVNMAIVQSSASTTPEAEAPVRLRLVFGSEEVMHATSNTNSQTR